MANPTIDAVCNFLKKQRKNSREYSKKNTKSKNISINLFKEGNCNIYSNLFVKFNKITGSITISPNSISWKGNNIYPTKIDKISCFSSHGLELFKKNIGNLENLRNKKCMSEINKILDEVEQRDDPDTLSPEFMLKIIKNKGGI